MSWIPAFEIGFWNAWMFMIVYPLQWLAVVVLPKDVAARTGHPADLKQDVKERAMGLAAQAVWIGATLYSVFLPLRVGTAWFTVGLAAFVAGLAALVFATVSVLRTPAGEPFTGGIYRFSRHPMYLSLILVYAGVSIAAASWLFVLLTLATFILQRCLMIQEERYCREKFGRAYGDYMDKTPRWIGIPKKIG